jgi:hypothetical protein
MTETARRGRRSHELPAPLPPETRTVGQLVAETIRLYGQRFWRVLPLGLSIAALDEVAFGYNLNVATLLLWAFAPLLTVSFVAASAIAAGVRLTARSALVAVAVGLVVFLPFPIGFRAFVLPGLALFAFCGLSVPAAIIERLPLRAALRRGVQLGKADFVHALGSLCTLAIVYFLSRTVLMMLLRGQGDATERIAGFLADLVLSPLLFLGSALLYYDQAARVRSSTHDGALPRGKPAPPGPVRHPPSR